MALLMICLGTSNDIYKNGIVERASYARIMCVRGPSDQR
jgi:hypothetical protein